MNTSVTQLTHILNHLASGRTLTQLEAFGLYGVYRLAARVHILKSRGHNIETKIKYDMTGRQYAEYRLVTRRADGQRKAA